MVYIHQVMTLREALDDLEAEMVLLAAPRTSWGTQKDEVFNRVEATPRDSVTHTSDRKEGMKGEGERKRGGRIGGDSLPAVSGIPSAADLTLDGATPHTTHHSRAAAKVAADAVKDQAFGERGMGGPIISNDVGSSSSSRHLHADGGTQLQNRSPRPPKTPKAPSELDDPSLPFSMRSSAYRLDHSDKVPKHTLPNCTECRGCNTELSFMAETSKYEAMYCCTLFSSEGLCCHTHPCAPQVF